MCTGGYPRVRFDRCPKYLTHMALEGRFHSQVKGLEIRMGLPQKGLQ